MTAVSTEDLAHTPAERAAAAAARTASTAPGPAAAEASKQAEAELFADAEEIKLGECGGDIVVIGAGLVGALCAVVLLRKGFRVHLFERYSDIRSIPSVGRSINLSVTSRGLRAIRALGGTLHDEMMEMATRITGRIIHMRDGKAMFQRYGKDDSECNYSISRIDLNKFLLNAASEAGVKIYFNHALSETSDFSGSDAVGCTLHFAKGHASAPESRVRIRCYCPVIACDGAGSRVRYALRQAGLTSFTEDVLPRGYKEVLFPRPAEGRDFGATGEGGGEACEGHKGLHIWPRGDHMLMALANRDGSFTGTIYMDNKGPEDSFEAFTNDEEGRKRCAAFCERYYADAVEHIGGMGEMVRQITTNPVGILGTVHASVWAVKGKVVLIGDACHAMVPFFGQGCNCGFEDTLWLSRFLDQFCGDGSGACLPERCTGENFATCFAALEQERKPNADAICDMALENFVEMRDRTGDVRFQAMKRLENKLENLFADKFRSRYAMVCYGGEGNVSYANAKDLGAVQNGILERLCANMGDLGTEELQKAEVDRIDTAEASRLIDDILVPELERLRIDLSTVKH